jgi:hypothetical protein
MRETRERMASVIVSFCHEKMRCDDTVRDDFIALCLTLVDKMCRKRPSPLERGKLPIWISAVIHAVGTMNFMFDHAQDIYVSPRELAAYFDSAASSVTTRSKVVRDMFKMTLTKPDWILPGRFNSTMATFEALFGPRRGRPPRRRRLWGVGPGRLGALPAAGGPVSGGPDGGPDDGPGSGGAHGTKGDETAGSGTAVSEAGVGGTDATGGDGPSSGER